MLSEENDYTLATMRAAAEKGGKITAVVEPWGVILWRDDLHWHLELQLTPYGRGSTDRDWILSGNIVGALDVPEDSLRTPFDTTDPNDVHRWVWPR